MKKTVFLAFVFITTQMGIAQVTSIQWQKTFGGTNDDVSTGVKQTDDGGYILVGYTGSTNGDVIGNHGSNDYWIVKLNGTGLIQWQKCLGGTGADYAFSIEQTSDGGYIVLGFTSSNDGDVIGNHGASDYWVVKLNSTGLIQWRKTLGGAFGDYAYSIVQTVDGGYVVAGYTFSSNGDVTINHGGNDYWLVKLNTTGAIQWQKTYGGNNDDKLTTVQQTDDGGYIVAGNSNSTNGDLSDTYGGFDCWILKINAAGAIQWQKSYGGSSDESARSIKQTVDGGYILGGYTTSIDGDITENHGNRDAWVVKINATGVIEWQKTFGGSANDQINGIMQTVDGGYITAGITYSSDGDVSENNGNGDCWVTKINSTGTMQWQKTMGGGGTEVANSIQQTADGGYIVASFTNSTNGDVTVNQGNNDYWVIKLTPDALASTTFIKTDLMVYPNPTNSVLNIQTDAQIKSIRITDLLGKTILTQTQNTESVNVANLAKGIYILEVFSGTEKIVSKFVKE